MENTDPNEEGTGAEIRKLARELFPDIEEESKGRTVSRTGRKNDESSDGRQGVLDNPLKAEAGEGGSDRSGRKQSEYTPSRNLQNPVFDIREIKQRDMLRALGNVGVLSLADAHKYFYRENVKRLEENNFIKRVQTVAQGRLVSFYVLAERGKNYARRYLVMGSLYRRNPSQVHHDIELSKVYLGLKREERLNWMNDEGVKQYLKDKGDDYRVLDGAYINKDGEIVGVEVFTRNYSNEVAAGKMRTIMEQFQHRVIRRVQF